MSHNFLALQNQNPKVPPQHTRHHTSYASQLTSSAWSKVKAANSRTSSSTSCKLRNRGNGDQELQSTGGCSHKPQTITNWWNDMGHGDDENDSESMKRFYQCIWCFVAKFLSFLEVEFGTCFLHKPTSPHMFQSVQQRTAHCVGKLGIQRPCSINALNSATFVHVKHIHVTRLNTLNVLHCAPWVCKAPTAFNLGVADRHRRTK